MRFLIRKCRGDRFRFTFLLQQVASDRHVRKHFMLGLILTLLFVALAAGILVAAGTVILQGYWYDSPVDGIPWRSAIAGAIVGLFFAVWCGIESKAPVNSIRFSIFRRARPLFTISSGPCGRAIGGRRRFSTRSRAAIGAR